MIYRPCSRWITFLVFNSNFKNWQKVSQARKKHLKHQATLGVLNSIFSSKILKVHLYLTSKRMGNRFKSQRCINLIRELIKISWKTTKVLLEKILKGLIQSLFPLNPKPSIHPPRSSPRKKHKNLQKSINRKRSLSNSSWILSNFPLLLDMSKQWTKICW